MGSPHSLEEKKQNKRTDSALQLLDFSSVGPISAFSLGKLVSVDHLVARPDAQGCRVSLSMCFVLPICHQEHWSHFTCLSRGWRGWEDSASVSKSRACCSSTTGLGQWDKERRSCNQRSKAGSPRGSWTMVGLFSELKPWSSSQRQKRKEIHTDFFLPSALQHLANVPIGYGASSLLTWESGSAVWSWAGQGQWAGLQIYYTDENECASIPKSFETWFIFKTRILHRDFYDPPQYGPSLTSLPFLLSLILILSTWCWPLLRVW